MTVTQRDTLQLRVTSVRTAASRARWVFAALTVASLGQIIVVWNMYMSWVRGLAFHDLATSETTHVLQTEALKDWVRSLSISVPVLGVNVSVNELSTIGGLALTTLMVWFWYCMRRENHLIGGLLRDAQDADDWTRAFVFHGVADTQVFATVSTNDIPYAPDDQPQTIVSVRLFVRALAYLPALAIAFAIVGDICSIFVWRAPFRERNNPVYEYLDASDYAEILIRTLVGTVCMVYCVVLGAFVNRFNRRNARLLSDVNSWGIPFERP